LHAEATLTKPHGPIFRADLVADLGERTVAQSASYVRHGSSVSCSLGVPDQKRRSEIVVVIVVIVVIIHLFFGEVVYAIADFCECLANQSDMWTKEGHTSRQVEELAANDHGLSLGLIARHLAAPFTAAALLGVICLGVLPFPSVYWSAKVWDNI